MQQHNLVMNDIEHCTDRKYSMTHADQPGPQPILKLIDYKQIEIKNCD